MEERYTNFIVDYELVDTTAAEDANYTTTFNQPFADVTQLSTEDSFPGNWITLEHNYSILDGSMEEFPDVPENVVFFNNEISDMNGEFDTPPSIVIDFTRTHSTFALTFDFVGDYPLVMNIAWYSLKDVILYNADVEVHENHQVINIDYESFGKLIITFKKTLPEHFIKLSHIKYGMTVKWTEKNIKSGTLTQEIDRTGDKISINTLSFDVVDVDDGMNFGNATGIHRYFQKNQYALAYEFLNGKKIDLGKFYLKTFSESSDLGKMSWQSAMGLLDNFTFRGEIYDQEPVANILDDIFNTCGGLLDFEVDGEVGGILLTGALGRVTCRKALREVLFATGAIALTIGTDIIRIQKPSPFIVDNTLTRNTKFSTKVAKRDYYYTVTIETTNFTLDEEESQIAKGVYPSGNNIVTFSQPCYNVSISDGDIISRGTYYVEFELEEETEVTIMGKKYTGTKTSISVNDSELKSGEIETEKKYTSALCDATLAAERGYDILKLLNYELQFTIEHLARDITMDDQRFVENASSGYKDYIAMFTKRNFKLTSGFTDNCTMIGYFNPMDPTYYCGIELYANDSLENGAIL